MYIQDTYVGNIRIAMNPRVEKWKASIDDNVSKRQNFHDRYTEKSLIRRTGPLWSVRASDQSSLDHSEDSSDVPPTVRPTVSTNVRPNVRKTAPVGAGVEDNDGVANLKRRSVSVLDSADASDTVASKLGFTEYDDDLDGSPRDATFLRNEEMFFALVAGSAFTSINNLRIRELVDASKDEYLTKISPHLLSAIESSRQHVEDLVGSQLYAPMSKLCTVYGDKRYRVLFAKVVANAYTSAKQRSSQRNYSTSQLVVNTKDLILLDGQIRKFFGADEDIDHGGDTIFRNIRYSASINKHQNRRYRRY